MRETDKQFINAELINQVLLLKGKYLFKSVMISGLL